MCCTIRNRLFVSCKTYSTWNVRNEQHKWNNIGKVQVMSGGEEVQKDYFGPNLSALRKSRSISRQALIDLLKDTWGITMHSTTLRRIESGEQSAKALEAMAIADLFQQDLTRMITRPISEDDAFYLALKQDLARDEEAVYWAVKGFMDSYNNAEEALASVDSDVPTAALTELKKYFDSIGTHIELARDVRKEWAFRSGSR